MNWSRVDYCDALSAIWTLMLMAPIHRRGFTGEQVLHYSKSVPKIKQTHLKQTHIHLGWPRVHFQNILFWGKL